MFLLKWHNTAWMKEKTRWLLLLSNSVLEPRCRTHKYMHTTISTRTRRCVHVYVFVMCHKIEMKTKRKENKTTKQRRQRRRRYEYFVLNMYIAHSRIVRKSTTDWKLFRGSYFVSNGRGGCRHHYCEWVSEQLSTSESIRFFRRAEADEKREWECAREYRYVYACVNIWKTECERQKSVYRFIR